MKNRKINFIVSIVLLFGMIIFSTQVLANPPDEINLKYNFSTQNLDVEIIHPTLDSNSHYIYKVDIKVNGNLYLSEQYTNQPSNTFIYSYIIEAEPGDEISVSAFCSLYGSLTETITIFDLNSPNAPEINGVTKGASGKKYDYTFKTTDPNNDDIYLYIEWGDGNFEEWIGPYKSGEEVILSHSWDDKGIYIIRAKAKDITELEGPWGIIEINMPKTKWIFSNIIREIINIIIQKISII
ncbi:MAG: hypothetical protein JSV67_07530 [Thermoplasmatales archaeon]|nr:MAG: hypothetical protein JSV67_07530 [Thermoplasmatales archaeon]